MLVGEAGLITDFWLIGDDVYDRSDNGTEYSVLAVGIVAVTTSAVIAILVTAAKSLTEVVIVLVHRHIVTVITEGRILVPIGISIVETPSILAISLSGVESLFVTVPNGVAQHLGTILACIIVVAAAVITIIVVIIVVIPHLAEPFPVTPEPLPVPLLITKIGISALFLQLAITLLFDILRISPLLVILIPSLPLELLLLAAVDLLIAAVIFVISGITDRAAALIRAVAPRILLLAPVIDPPCLVIIQLTAFPASRRLDVWGRLIRYGPAVRLRKV